MGSVVLDIARARNGGLPAVCVVCGATATQWKKIDYSWRQSYFWWVAVLATSALMKACAAYGDMGGTDENISAVARFELYAKIAIGIFGVWLFALLITGKRLEAVLPFCEKDVSSGHSPTVNTITTEHLVLDSVNQGFIDAVIRAQHSNSSNDRAADAPKNNPP